MTKRVIAQVKIATNRFLNRMRLTERRRQLIPQIRRCISKTAVGDLEWGRYRWSS